MSSVEYAKMTATGQVQESYSGTTHVLLPPIARGFMRQAKPGAIYVEFDVPSNCLKATGQGWAKIVGPNSIEGRAACRRGQPVPIMPAARNIQHVASLLTP
jgi:hypothetical protein